MSNDRSDTTLRVGQLARENVVSVPGDAPIGEVARTMVDERVGDVLVTEADDLVGIVTDRDLVVHLLTDDHGTNVLRGEGDPDLTARDVMTEDPLTIDPNARVPRVLHHMTQGSVRRVPVVDDGSLTGVVTFDDLLVHLAGESEHVAAQLESLADVVHAQSPRPE